jgi:hypothetical protein
MQQGKFEEAFQMDVDDLLAKGLYEKYKTGIDQAWEVIRGLRREGALQ